MRAFRRRPVSPPTQDSSSQSSEKEPGASRDTKRPGSSNVDLPALVAVLSAIVLLAALHSSADQIVALMSAAGVLYTAWRASR